MLRGACLRDTTMARLSQCVSWASKASTGPMDWHINLRATRLPNHWSMELSDVSIIALSSTKSDSWGCSQGKNWSRVKDRLMCHSQFRCQAICRHHFSIVVKWWVACKSTTRWLPCWSGYRAVGRRWVSLQDRRSSNRANYCFLGSLIRLTSNQWLSVYKETSQAHLVFLAKDSHV